MQIKDFLIERFYAKYEFLAPYMLSSSDSESFNVEDILNLEADSKEKFLKLYLQYTETQGNPKLRAAIQTLYKIITKEQILVFSGAEEGIFAFIFATLRKDDHFIVSFPCYQSSYEVANANGVEISYWNFSEKNFWKPDFESLQKLIQKNTKAILVNSPHNPSGYNFTKDEFNTLINLCKKHGLYLFSDEVYRLGEYQENLRLENAADLYKNAVSLGVLSKPLGLPGLRIGWIATSNKELFTKMGNFKDYTTICNSAPSEFLATIALKNYETLLKRNMKIVHSNLKLLDSFMEKHSTYFEWVRPSAGCIGFIKVKFTDDIELFCKNLLERKGVLLLPSTVYEYGNKHFRIGFGRKNFPQVLKLFEEYILETLNKS